MELATTTLEEREAAAAAAAATAKYGGATAATSGAGAAGGRSRGGGWWSRLRGRPGSWDWLWKLTLLFWGEFLIVNLVRVVRRELPLLRTPAGRGVSRSAGVWAVGERGGGSLVGARVHKDICVLGKHCVDYEPPECVGP